MEEHYPNGSNQSLGTYCVSGIYKNTPKQYNSFIKLDLGGVENE